MLKLINFSIVGIKQNHIFLPLFLSINEIRAICKEVALFTYLFTLKMDQLLNDIMIIHHI